MRDVYYWMYRGLKRIRRDDDPKFDALLGIVFFQGLNIIVIGRVVFKLFPFNVTKELVILSGILLSICLFAIDYLLFYKKRESILKNVPGYSKRRLRTGKILFIIYVILSASAFYSMTLFFD